MRNSSRYSIDWNDVIRPDILKRAGYKCDKCKIANRSVGYRLTSGQFIVCDKFLIEWCASQGIKVKRVFLQICHIDHNPSNNDYSNLMCLCPRCHAFMDKDHRVAMRISSK